MQDQPESVRRPIRNPSLPRKAITFAHPSEKEFASVLDFYGIRWEYEPYTFPLAWDEHGNILEAFSPDFYLVDQDTFIELTTLRQRLIRLKRRKLRELVALYPDVKIKLWNRKDFEWMLRRYGIEEHAEELVGKEALSHADE
ncbi:MAG: hypothetical protein ACOX2L_01730 [Anaerolineae bacterium]|jgi:hypothetical protein|nr:hypothetical protein [Chloroflexota bacterium]